jgi:hypothetical protein
VPRRTQAAFVALLQEQHLQTIPSSFKAFQCRFLASKALASFAPSLCGRFLKEAQESERPLGRVSMESRIAVQIWHRLFSSASTSKGASIHSPSRRFPRAMARWRNSSFPSVMVVVMSWLPSRGYVKCVKASLRAMYIITLCSWPCEDECPRCCCFDVLVSISQTSPQFCKHNFLVKPRCACT